MSADSGGRSAKEGGPFEALAGMSKRPSDEGPKKVMVKDLMINHLGSGGSALESWQNLLREKIRGSEGKASDELKCTLSELLGKADEVCKQLLLERQEMYVEARRENEDLMSHIDLIRKRFEAASAENSTFREMRKQAAADMEKSSEQLRDVSTQYRSLQSQHAATLGQLRNAEASAADWKKRYVVLEEQVSASRPHAGFASSPGDGDGGSGSDVRCEDMELIDDLAEDLLDAAVWGGETDDLSAELQRLESRLRAEESRTREVSEQFKACQQQLTEANRKLEAMEIAAKLDEVISKAPNQVVLSPRIISPRGSDIQSVRKKFLEQYDALRRKDEEIEELQKILFELRPKLEKDVEGQVKAIIEQAQHDAHKLRSEATRMWETSSNRVNWLETDVENLNREIEVLQGAAIQRDELLRMQRELASENATLHERISKLEPHVAPQAPSRVGVRAAWGAVVLTVGIAVAAVPLALGAVCGPGDGTAAGVASASPQGGGPPWLARLGRVIKGGRGGGQVTPSTTRAEESKGMIGVIGAPVASICGAISRGDDGGGRAGVLIAVGMVVGSVLTLVLPSSGSSSATG